MTRFNVGYTQAVIDAADIWRDNSTSDAILPTGLSISEEYISRYNAAYGDVDAYTAENVNRFITGDRPLEEFEAFVQELKGVGADTCLEIWQKMLDAYNTK